MSTELGQGWDGPREFFARHPGWYWVALAGPVITCVYAVEMARRSPGARRSSAYAALAVLTAVQAVGLARIRPGRAR